jgi:hypothetical protein
VIAKALALGLAGCLGCAGADSTASSAPDAAMVARPDLAEPPPPDLAPPPPPPPPPLEVQFLGVGGFSLAVGPDLILTVPLYTRPSLLDVTTGTVASDSSLVASSLPAGAAAKVSAILAGHAHYDHLLDAPSVLAAAPQATLYANTTARHLLAALAPDEPGRCGGAPPVPLIPRQRVVALDDPAASTVDYRSCPSEQPQGAPLQGSWTRIPGTDVRILPICSSHPDQLGPIHFAPGSVADDQCVLPPKASDWLEGPTLAFLIDFLDPRTGAPRYRIYYQDAPTTAPVGHPPPDLLAEKRVDLAILCVGNYDKVDDAPGQTLAALDPRYALGGHWEDFFQSAGNPPQPIPFLDVPTWTTRAVAALPPSLAVAPMRHNGQPEPERAVLPQPGDTFTIVP